MTLPESQRKTILITGSTDGIGLKTAELLVSAGHNVLLHGRNAEKLKAVEQTFMASVGEGTERGYVGDLSDLYAVEALATAVINDVDRLDVLINNAGVLKAPSTVTASGLDVRFCLRFVAVVIVRCSGDKSDKEESVGGFRCYGDCVLWLR